jgi:predicted acyl esterase
MAARRSAFPGGAFRQRDIEGWLQGQGSPHMIDSIYAHPSHDEWWSWWDTEARHPLETIPTYQLGGWFDLFAQGTVDSYNGLQRNGGTGARGNQKLVMGPERDHGDATDRLLRHGGLRRPRRPRE